MILGLDDLQHQRRCRHQPKSQIKPASLASIVPRFQLVHAPPPHDENRRKGCLLSIPEQLFTF